MDEQSNEEYVDYGSIGFDAGPYSFYVKDSNGCKSEELTFKFNEPKAISPTAGNIAIVVHNPECHADNTNDSNKTLEVLSFRRFQEGFLSILMN